MTRQQHPIASLTLFSELVQLIQLDLDNPATLLHLLQRLSDYIDSANATLVARPQQAERLAFVVSSAKSRATTLAFQNDLFRIDPFVNLPANSVKTISDYIDVEQWQQHPFFISTMKASGLLHVLGVDMHHRNGILSLRLTRTADSPDFDQHDRELCALLVPHFLQTLDRQHALHTERSQNQVYDEATSQLAVATLILDEQQKLISSNSYADALIAQTPGICIRAQQLQLQDVKLQTALRGMLHALIAEDDNPIPPRALLLNEFSEHAMALVAKRIAQTPTAPESRFALFISKPHKRLDFSATHLAALFGLTPAEAKLAGLIANGLILDDAASELGISRYTAKAQLRAVFSKTGVGQQSHLVHLLLKSISNIA